MSVLDQYMASFNALDIEAHLDTYHFPHYRLAGGKMLVLDKRSDFNRADLEKFLEGIGWHHSQWDKREISMQSENKIQVNTRFTRYREDDTIIASFDSLYVLTRENVEWGIILRSSFAQ